MRAITIQQPWASAIIWGGKDIENRTWRTKHRGPLLIHAGSGRFRKFDAHAWMRERFPDLDLRGLDCLRGALLGTVDVVDCVRDSSSPWAFRDCWHWVLANPQPLVSPFACSGRLGLWFPDQAILAQFNVVSTTEHHRPQVGRDDLSH